MPQAIRVIDRFADLADVNFGSFSDGQYAKYDQASGKLIGGTPSGGMSDPMTTIGDLIYRNGSNVTARLAVGGDDTVLKVVSGLPAWTDQATVKATGHQLSLYTAGAERVRVDDTATKLTVLLNNLEGGSSGNTLFDMYSTILTGYLGVTLIAQATNTDISLQPIRAVYIKDSPTPPATNPAGGGYLYVESGALKYRGSSGSIVTLAPA